MRISPSEFKRLYTQFHMPVTIFDCGNKCAPYHPKNIPYCCDTEYVIPSAYQSEWQYLKTHTNLWNLWEHPDSNRTKALSNELPADQLLIMCRGHMNCEREFRSICCRSFPFFPYMDQNKTFIGITYYWEYADVCWLISNLSIITQEYLISYFDVYDHLLKLYPDEIDNFYEQSKLMRSIFKNRRRNIYIISRNNHLINQISPNDGRMKSANPRFLPKFGPYKIADTLPFPDEKKPS